MFVSAAAIGYEILLMRVLSIVQWHHFAYMIISLALLGYGASGTFIALNRHWLTQRFEAAFATSAVLCSVSMLLCFILAQRVPFNALEIIWDWHQLVSLAAIYVIFFVPFFFAACCIGLAFTCRQEDISRIYFFDLAGAGLGAVLVIGLLFMLLPQQALLVLLLLPLSASIVLAPIIGLLNPLVMLSVAWAIFVVIGVPESWLALRLSDYKGLSQATQVVGSNVVATRSSPLGLLTVVESPTVPFRHAPGLSFGTRHVPPEQIGVFTDGDAMTAITRFDGDLRALGYLEDMTAALPYKLVPSPRVLVLGAGGGSDVLLALSNGARHVDAVELNSQLTNLIRGDYAEFAGRLYDDPRVTVHTREARGFVAQTESQYDVIHIGLLDSFGASGAGVQSLHESYLYTVEGLQEYLEHLSPGGFLAITRWLKLPPRDSLKLFAIAIEALRASGNEVPGNNLAMIRSWNTTTLLVGKSPITESDVAMVRDFAESRSFDTVFYPRMPPAEANRFNQLDEPHFYRGVTALLGAEADAFLGRYKFHIAAATDNRPYFFHFFKWNSLREVLALRQSGGAGLIEWGYLLIVATIAQAMVSGGLLILLPLARVRRTWPAGTGAWMGCYFFLLGLAFLFIEIAFIQKFILFLSHPLYSVAVVLAAFLVFAGLGSRFSGTLKRERAVDVAAGTIASITTLYIFLLPTLFGLCVGFADGVKVTISVLLIAPLAFAMGMPFPLGLRQLAEHASDFIPWAWGINGFASVLSAALAALLAIEFGFTAVLVLAMAAYAGAAVTMRHWGT